MMRFMRADVALLSASLVLLSGCGGDGLGGADTPVFSTSVSEVFFGTPLGGAQPSDKTITGTVSNYSGTLYLYVVHTTNGLSGVGFPVMQGNGGTSSITPKHPTAIGQGAYFDTITISACSDASCNTHLSGSPKTIPVTYVVGIATVPSSLAFSSAAGVAPPAQTVSLYHYQQAQSWGSSYLFLTGSDWMTYDPFSGQAPTTVTVNVNAMPIGTAQGSIFNAEIRFGANAGTDRFTLPITYTIE